MANNVAFKMKNWYTHLILYYNNMTKIWIFKFCRGIYLQKGKKVFIFLKKHKPRSNILRQFFEYIKFKLFIWKLKNVMCLTKTLTHMIKFNYIIFLKYYRCWWVDVSVKVLFVVVFTHMIKFNYIIFLICYSFIFFIVPSN